MKKAIIFLFSFAMVLVVACNTSGYKKTSSGLLYKIISKGDQPPTKRGSIMKFNFLQKVRDSVIVTTFDKSPYYLKADSVPPMYDPSEVLIYLRKGDSAVIVLMADSILKKQGRLPEFLHKNDRILICLRVLDVFPNDSAAHADQVAENAKTQKKLEAEAEKLKAPTIQSIEKYLDSAKLKATKAPEGTYVVVQDPGTGKQADTGKYVTVKYTGKLFPSGKQFESNSYSLTIGKHQAIAGWDDGLRLFKQGGKGQLYIPFWLGYGNGPGPGGQPHESLIFDVEITSVADSMPRPVQQPAARPNAPLQKGRPLPHK
jgi:FKBP-type peptidyl-prolyl cis-trans isomerase